MDGRLISLGNGLSLEDQVKPGQYVGFYYGELGAHDTYPVVGRFKEVRGSVVTIEKGKGDMFFEFMSDGGVFHNGGLRRLFKRDYELSKVNGLVAIEEPKKKAES